MEHNKNTLAPVAEYDSATGTFITRVTAEPVESIEPVPFDRQRDDGWTPARQRQFLEELADCGIIREAAARVGMSPKSAWELRRRAYGTAFATAWEGALQAGMKQLHAVAFERAIEGVLKRTYYRGEVIGEERVYDNRLLLSLLGKAGDPFNVDMSKYAHDKWQDYLDAVEQGFNSPQRSILTDAGKHLWRNEHGTWWTDFPPPEHANVTEEGEYGDKDYCRTLTEEEHSRVIARDARRAEQKEAQRDFFFSAEK